MKSAIKALSILFVTALALSSATFANRDRLTEVSYGIDLKGPLTLKITVCSQCLESPNDGGASDQSESQEVSTPRSRWQQRFGGSLGIDNPGSTPNDCYETTIDLFALADVSITPEAGLYMVKENGVIKIRYTRPFNGQGTPASSITKTLIVKISDMAIKQAAASRLNQLRDDGLIGPEQISAVNSKIDALSYENLNVQVQMGLLVDYYGDPVSPTKKSLTSSSSSITYDYSRCVGCEYESYRSANPEECSCGNGVCEAEFGENMQTCPDDCTCGNGICDENETAITCPDDCSCGDGVCDPSQGENGDTCADDCTCGNGICDENETAVSCPDDCSCGDGVCDESGGENSETCPDDCPCGDGVCDESAGENQQTCSDDCYCGNGICEATETVELCPDDCAVCGDSKVTGNETCDDGLDNGKPGKCGLDCKSYGNGYCTELSMQGKNEAEIKFTNTFTCKGMGDLFEIVVKRNGTEIKRYQKSTEFTQSILFDVPGSYVVECLVDGSYSLSCTAGESVGDSVEKTLQKLLGALDRSSVSVIQKGSSILTKSEDLYVQIRTTQTLLEECTPQCMALVTALTTCGNGLLEPQNGEMCDDGNQTENDGCSEVCAIEDGWECPVPGELCKEICGDGKIVGGEICDDGVKNGTPGFCSLQCDGTVPLKCGDGVKHSDEQCDDGNTVSGDGCSSSCKTEGGGGGGGGNTFQECGNGRIDSNPIKDYYEECEFDNQCSAGERCSRACTCEEGSGGGGSTGGGNSGGGRGGGGSNRCGNNRVDPGEECDAGAGNNGDEKSICKSNCTLKGFATDGPKCSFIDPPSIQENEYLPFRWALEEDGWIIEGNNCSSAKTVGQVPAGSAICHFTVEMPDDTTYSFERPCFEDQLSKDAKRYADLVSDLESLYGEYGILDPERGKSYVMLSEARPNYYGEFAIQLEKITYDICIQNQEDGDFSSVRQEYGQRVCQYNFAVTTPYFIQKGASLSSEGDDKQKLGKFRKLDGRTILDVSGIHTLEDISVQDAFENLKQQVDTYIPKAVEFVGARHQLGSLGVTTKKVPAEEIYVIDSSFTMPANVVFNEGIPTTIIVLGNTTVRVEGSLQANVLIVAPEGTIEFVNTDCDANDEVKGILVAKSFVAGSSVYDVIANNSLRKIERCMGGGLAVEGIMIGLQPAQLDFMKTVRRSTLKDRFRSVSTLQDKIFDGAAVRVDVNAGVWTNLPPLADIVLKSLEIMRNVE